MSVESNIFISGLHKKSGDDGGMGLPVPAIYAQNRLSVGFLFEVDQIDGDGAEDR